MSASGPSGPLVLITIEVKIIILTIYVYLNEIMAIDMN